MSNFLSTPVLSAQQKAKTLGIPVLSRSQYLEVAASLFGYKQYKLMKPSLPGIENALKRAEAALILDVGSANRRAVQLMGDDHASFKDAKQNVELLVDELRSLPAGPLYMSEDDFYLDHVQPFYEAHFLSQLNTNPQLSAEHDKVREHCSRVEYQDSDFIKPVWVSREVWEVSLGVSIEAPKRTGTHNESDEYLLAWCEAQFQKLDRAIVSTRIHFLDARAQATRFYNTTSFGERIL